ncbi:hypothetical protein FQN54_006787 [Arachnomyces sp. PD_36]|nr:hypothetical protein FQN54_006787 [Arachnomyces sp. PD_36]
MYSFSILSLSLSILIRSVLAFPVDDQDLTTFVSEPEIKAPLFDVTIHNKDRVSPGYWFVAPYWLIRPEEATNRYMPCQIGPHIYDGDGTLIWTGACRFQNSNVFDFNTVEIDNQTYISFIHNNSPDLEQNPGYGVILDENYHEIHRVPNPEYVKSFNMHEFNLIDNGRSALSTLYKAELVDMSDINLRGRGYITAGGIFEQDVETGATLFQWDGHDHIPLNESTGAWPRHLPDSEGAAFDYVHVNAVDKTTDGDYLLSARFTDTIYKISGKTGDIVWRLGGPLDDFVHHDFSFRRQHHVRHIESNTTHMTISMLNNAADEGSDDGTPSAVLFIRLDMSASPMTATLLSHYDRPDHDLTRLRGSAQLLPDGNIFAGWSQQGYQSEFTPDGEVVMEAKFVSDRFSSYRSYKGLWTGRPTAPPAIKSMAFGASVSGISTTVWVSWNGCTDIDSWNFYGHSSRSSEPILLGNARKTGFETMFMATGYMGWVTAEALDADGNTIGKSEVEETIAPANWNAAGFDTQEIPEPMDPSAVIAIKEKLKNQTAAMIDDDGVPANGNFSTVADQSFSDAFSSAFKSNEGLVIFCIALLVVVGCGLLFGIFWRFRPHLMKPKKTYLPIASDENGDEPRDERNRTI